MALNQGVPNPGYPLIDSTGKINPVWFQFLVSLWQRTGGGANTGNIQSIAVSASNGIIANSTESSGNAVIDLSLLDITPTNIVTQGQITGNTGFFYSGLTNLGNMQFGTYVAGGTGGQTGTITITDVDGVSRQLMVK